MRSRLTLLRLLTPIGSRVTSGRSRPRQIHDIPVSGLGDANLVPYLQTAETCRATVERCGHYLSVLQPHIHRAYRQRHSKIFFSHDHATNPSGVPIDFGSNKQREEKNESDVLYGHG